jgi:hypothetical protein
MGVNEMRFGPFLFIAFFLIFLWISGFLMFHIAGALLHLVLLLAVISIVVHLLTGKRHAA